MFNYGWFKIIEIEIIFVSVVDDIYLFVVFFYLIGVCFLEVLVCYMCYIYVFFGYVDSCLG